MRRVGGFVVVRHVAVGASRARDVEIAERGDVTLIALQSRVGVRQRESRRGMVENRPTPAGHRCVARIARLREVRRDVTGFVRVVEIMQVARIARRREPGRLVVRVGGAVEVRHVAVGASPVGNAVIAELSGVALLALQTGVRAR